MATSLHKSMQKLAIKTECYINVMVLTLVRDTFTPSETLGKLLVNRKTFCDTLEPPAVPNAMHPKGTIPMGWYKLQVTMSPVFGRRLPQL